MIACLGSWEIALMTHPKPALPSLSKRSALLALLVPGVWSLLAQSPEASLSGRVSDAQGAVIAGARVTAVNRATGIKTAVTSNPGGVFVIRPLPVGSYGLFVEHAGFKRFEHSAITLTTGQSLELNVSLEVGSVAENVLVTASTQILETRTSDVGQLVESKTIEDMPLGDRRSMNMVNIMGGAVFVNYDAGAKPNFSLAGGRTQSQMLWLDGGSGQNQRLGVGQMDIDPPVEVVQEVKILANNYSAEYGGSAGGVVITTLKSGTNKFRGSVFEYLRNDKLDAANFFAPVQDNRKIKAPLRYNVFGATVGGPIRRDRTFFFFSYEGSRRSEGSTRTLTVPSELQRAGDFSATRNAAGAVVPIYDPATTRQEGGRIVRDVFPGNRIPTGRLDPVAVRLMPFYPLPNRTPDNATGANNYRANGGIRLNRNNYTAKVDHNIGSRDRLGFRYLRNSDNRFNASIYPEAAAETVTDTPADQSYLFASWTRTVSPSVVNDLRFNYGTRGADARSKGLDGNWPSKIGLRGVPEDAFPQVSAAGFAGLGAGTHRRYSRPFTNLQFVDNVSWIRGHHAFKAGGDVRQSGVTDWLRQSISGSFTFSTLPTGQPGTAASGNGLATMLIGFPTAFTIRDTPALRRTSWYLSGFFQDDWTVTRRLTLNIGLRWETDTPIKDLDDRMNGFDLDQINPVSRTPGVVKFGGVNNWRTLPYDTDWNNFGPRFGFAWKPFTSEKTVVRGGFGIAFAHPFDHGAPTSASLGYEVSTNLTTPDNGITAPFYLRDGVPVSGKAEQLNDSFGAVAVGQPATTAVTFYEIRRRAGYSQQFNLGIQRELFRETLVEISYLGSLARKLSSANIPMNQIRPERLGPSATQRDRPYPQFSNLSIVFPAFGVSSYHAGLVRLEKRFSRGFNILSTYTFSKFLNNVDDGTALGNEGSPYSDYYNRRADWGPSENDIRHRFTLSTVYELPFGRTRRWLKDNPFRYVAGDWSLSCVATVQTAPPLTVTTQTNTTNSFSAGSLRADVLASPNLAEDSRTLLRWFDTAAFRQPAQFKFGNQGVNTVRGDGQKVINLAVLRSFPIRDQARVQFRGEFLNAINHPNFGLPGAIFGAPGFGVVSSAFSGRQVQLGIRLVY
ncbi:MAG TPA: carboxypeptidase regulatory-like domain-containing protein [Bryobacteraceae bacterium]|nr:carboxypeptidase regulatory-like domain-containing protein [Bryobacteraceae bacterium]